MTAGVSQRRAQTAPGRQSLGFEDFPASALQTAGRLLVQSARELDGTGRPNRPPGAGTRKPRLVYVCRSEPMDIPFADTAGICLPRQRFPTLIDCSGWRILPISITCRALAESVPAPRCQNIPIDSAHLRDMGGLPLAPDSLCQLF